MLLNPDADKLISNRLFLFIRKGILKFMYLWHIGRQIALCFSKQKHGRAKLTEGDKEKYTGKTDLSAERKQGERPDKRQM